MEKLYPNKICWCPVCNQGWVEIVKEKETGNLFICCSECEIEWDHPDEVTQENKGTRFKYGQVVEPSLVEIDEVGWKGYIMKTK